MELNPVPYMMTLGGQQFKQAYANLVMQYCGGLVGLGGGGCAGARYPVPARSPRSLSLRMPLKGTGYCNGFSSCTAAVAANEGCLRGTQ